MTIRKLSRPLPPTGRGGGTALASQAAAKEGAAHCRSRAGALSLYTVAMDHVEGYTVVYRLAEDVILAEVPAIPGCFSDGRTLEKARERVRDAILNFLDEFKEAGEEIPSDMLYVERVHLGAA